MFRKVLKFRAFCTFFPLFYYLLLLLFWKPTLQIGVLADSYLSFQRDYEIRIESLLTIYHPKHLKPCNDYVSSCTSWNHIAIWPEVHYHRQIHVTIHSGSSNICIPVFDDSLVVCSTKKVKSSYTVDFLVCLSNRYSRLTYSCVSFCVSWPNTTHDVWAGWKF